MAHLPSCQPLGINYHRVDVLGLPTPNSHAGHKAGGFAYWPSLTDRWSLVHMFIAQLLIFDRWEKHFSIPRNFFESRVSQVSLTSLLQTMKVVYMYIYIAVRASMGILPYGILYQIPEMFLDFEILALCTVILCLWIVTIRALVFCYCWIVFLFTDRELDILKSSAAELDVILVMLSTVCTLYRYCSSS